MKRALAFGVLLAGTTVVWVFERVASRLHAWDPQDWQGIEEDYDRG